MDLGQRVSCFRGTAGGLSEEWRQQADAVSSLFLTGLILFTHFEPLYEDATIQSLTRKKQHHLCLQEALLSPWLTALQT